MVNPPAFRALNLKFIVNPLRPRGHGRCDNIFRRPWTLSCDDSFFRKAIARALVPVSIYLAFLVRVRHGHFGPCIPPLHIYSRISSHVLVLSFLLLFSRSLRSIGSDLAAKTTITGRPRSMPPIRFLC